MQGLPSSKSLSGHLPYQSISQRSSVMVCVLCWLGSCPEFFVQSVLLETSTFLYQQLTKKMKKLKVTHQTFDIPKPPKPTGPFQKLRPSKSDSRLSAKSKLSTHTTKNRQYSKESIKQNPSLKSFGSQRDPLQISKMLGQASSYAQSRNKIELHKELLDKHVSKLIDIIQSQNFEIKTLKKQLKPIQGKSLLNKFTKSHSQTDLLQPFRSLQETDLKRYFLHQKIEECDFIFEESAIEATYSQRHSTSIHKFDEDNRSVLVDQHSALSASGIECDLIRLQRIDQQQVRQQHLRDERLFTESLQNPLLERQVESSCDVISDSERSFNRVTRNQHVIDTSYQTSQIQRIAATLSRSRVMDDHGKYLQPVQRSNTVNSSDTEKLSFTAADDNIYTQPDYNWVKSECECESVTPSLQQIRRTQIPQLRVTRNIIDQLNTQQV